LFQRFGFEDPVSEEAQFISRLVVEADPNITWARFQSIVRHHQARRILQGRHTLFIVPKALHVHLWVQFWNEYGLGFNFQKFMERLPAGLKHWFLRLFIYAHASPVAQAAVKKILASSTGPFAERAFLESEAYRLVGAVRVSAARDAKAKAGCAVHPGHHFRAVVLGLPQFRFCCI
jgi:hypothetical protein